MKAKRVLGGMLAAALIALNFVPSVQSMRNIPELIHLTQGQEKSYSFFLPVKVEVEQEGACVSSSTDETLGSRSPTLTTQDVGSTRVTFRLLGCIPLRTATVQVDDERVLIPGGQSIGLTMFTDGVFIVDCASVYRADGTAAYPAREAGLTSGDCITGVGGKGVDSMQALMEAVHSCDGPLEVEYVRDGTTRRTTVTPAVDESGEKRLGVWVRDSTAGIGTLTFVDPQTGTFGALGHAVTDQDTGKVLPIRSGEVYLSEIIDVKKGSRGEAGELHGVFTGGWNSALTLKKNTEFGVYGTAEKQITNALYPQGLPIAAQSEIEAGPATLLTTIDGSGVREFSCRIVRVNPQLTAAPRSMVVEITDPELLAVTGGIVQGMSGSPIIQDGKLVGAVTHVLVNDPTRGYGIFIENMLNAAG